MSDWWNLKNAIASIDSKLDQAMGLPTTTATDKPDPTPVTPVKDFDFPAEQLQFLDLYQQRFESLASKIKHLVTENEQLLKNNAADPAAATAKKIDLLIEEGTRLSAQELKLNATIRKLKKQLTEAAKPEAQLNTTQNELETLRSTSDAKIKALQGEIDEMQSRMHKLQLELDERNALVEHYKNQAPTGAVNGPSPRQLESLTQNHEQARENWLAVESKLLSSIASLESTIDQRDGKINELNEKTLQAQSQAQDLRDVAEQHRIALSESHTKHDQLKQQLADLQASQETQLSSFKSELAALREENKLLRERPEVTTTAASVADTVEESTPVPSTMPEQMYDDIEVPPLEPLEVSSLPIHDVGPTPNDSIDIDSRLDISAIGSVASMEVDTHLVAKLSQANRKLEAQLLMTQESLETARKEKEAAFSEMVKYMGAGESNTDLEEENKRLEAKLEVLLVKLGQKSEQVTELQADVQDLKEMYKEQVTDLVEQIQALKK